MKNSRNLIESLDITSPSSFPGALIPLTKLYFFRAHFTKMFSWKKLTHCLQLKDKLLAFLMKKVETQPWPKKYYSGFFHLM